MEISRLAAELSLLQKQFDSDEEHSLLIKLFGVGLLTAAYFADHLSFSILCLLLTLWL